MTNLSKELALIINLKNTSLAHQKVCIDAHCNVSLYQLKQAAEFIEKFMSIMDHKLEEREEAKKLISEMPII